MQVKNMKDLVSGLIFVVVGTGFGLGATSYRIGSATRMGPGYFPVLLSVLLVLIGAVICFRSLTVRTSNNATLGSLGSLGTWAFKPLIFITAANMLFGLLLVGWPALGIPALGIVVATMALVVVAAFAGRHFRLWEAIVLAACLSLAIWLVFVRGLHMPFQVWPDFAVGRLHELWGAMAIAS